MTPDATPPVVPLPTGYRLAELDNDADREAMIQNDYWAFSFEVTPEDEPHWVWTLEPGRSVGVWHDVVAGGRALAAHSSSHAFAMQVPGGDTVPTGGLTWVGVHPGHRRRGLARAMMHAHLERSVAAGEVVSALFAAEPGIYGRYGYGISSRKVSLTLGRGAGLRDLPGSEDLVVELDLLDPAKHAEFIDTVHRSVRRPGWITRDTEALRASHLTDWPSARRGSERLRVAVVRDPDGEARGYALFRRKEKWSDDAVPEGTVVLRDAVALDAPAARALWGVLSDLDLMAKVEVHALALDDPLMHLLTDVRSAGVRTHDELWLRILDVPAALAARRYQAPVEVVVEVRDELLAANAGRWRLRGDLDDAAVEATTDGADIALDVAELASAYLGGTSLLALAAAGRVAELTPGSLVRAAAAFGWPQAPAIGWDF